jgi:hypothetical protein
VSRHASPPPWTAGKARTSGDDLDQAAQRVHRSGSRQPRCRPRAARPPGLAGAGHRPCRTARASRSSASHSITRTTFSRRPATSDRPAATAARRVRSTAPERPPRRRLRRLLPRSDAQVRSRTHGRVAGAVTEAVRRYS